MKKNILLMLFCIGLGFYLAFLFFQSYQAKEVKPVSLQSNIEKAYFIQLGVYSNLDQMKQKLSDLKYYIYMKENEFYYAYAAITKTEENQKKLKDFFTNLGYDIYVKEIELDNPEFRKILIQYDTLLKETKDENAIMEICNQVLKKYEELVIHAKSKTDTKK